METASLSTPSDTETQGQTETDIATVIDRCDINTEKHALASKCQIHYLHSGTEYNPEQCFSFSAYDLV